MTVSGVIRVDNFNENTIVVVTEAGQMTIDGTNLHISRLSLEAGDMNVDGDIAGLFYSEDAYENGKKTPKLISKLFK
jgi:sporulation protein YabP